MTEPTLELNTLSKRFDAVQVLKGIKATVFPCKVIGLPDLNSAGKTTLLELCLLLAAVLFRTLAQRGFYCVDWQVLRHGNSKRGEAVSA